MLGIVEALRRGQSPPQRPAGGSAVDDVYALHESCFRQGPAGASCRPASPRAGTVHPQNMDMLLICLAPPLELLDCVRTARYGLPVSGSIPACHSPASVRMAVIGGHPIYIWLNSSVRSRTGTPRLRGWTTRRERKIRATRLRERSGSAASTRSTHSALPMFTSSRVRIISGNGATCSTWEGMPGRLGCSTTPSHCSRAKR